MTKRYSRRKYNVMEHDESWEKQFKAEARTIRSIFANDAIDVLHVGSTAVPKLAAKPTVDILVTVENVVTTEAHKDAMVQAGYKYVGEYVTNDSRLFVREEDNVRLSNVHVFPADHPHVKEMLLVRDYLRNHPDEVTQYGKLKRELYGKYPDDYGAYRKEKDEYMDQLLKRARRTAL